MMSQISSLETTIGVGEKGTELKDTKFNLNVASVSRNENHILISRDRGYSRYTRALSLMNKKTNYISVPIVGTRERYV